MRVYFITFYLMYQISVLVQVIDSHEKKKIEDKLLHGYYQHERKKIVDPLAAM